jgi:hypothetical protein
MATEMNLVLRSFDGGEELALAKVVQYPRDSNHWVIHAWVYPKYMRMTQGAWGVRFELAKFCADNGIEDLYFYDAKHKVTLHTTLAQVRALGTPSTESDRYGRTMNVPDAAWERRDGRIDVNFVPDAHRLVLAACLVPWRLPERDRRHAAVTSPPPAAAPQLSLFDA